MQTNILWSGIEYYSLENCVITTSNEGNTIKSTIIGYYQNKIYSAKYLIRTNNKWETYFLELNYSLDTIERTIHLHKNDNDWILNNNKQTDFNSCIDVDISITPFTNTLPVNRLQLSLQEQQTIKVIYINIFEEDIKPLEQSYTKLSNTKYLYQNIPNDFEAEVEVDESGFVVDYPTLFTRKASIKTN